MSGFPDSIRQATARFQTLGVFARLLLTGAVIFALAGGHFWIGLGLIAAAFLVSLVIAEKPQVERALGLFFAVSVPFGFALFDPSSAIAAMFAVFAFSVASAFDGEGRAFLIERSVICVSFGLACLMPERFGLICYVLGVIAFALAGWRFVVLRGAP